MEYVVIEPTTQVQRERLERLFRYAQIGQCVSSVTHDVNNFLGAIMAYAELIAMDETLPAESTRMVGEILAAVRKASGLVNNLTDVSRRERPDIRVIEPAQCVERVLDLRRFDIRTNHITLETNYADNLHTFAVDLPKIELALLYVLTNAIEACLALKEGSRIVKISVSQDQESVTVAIWNSGEPIGESTRESMFEPYFTTKSGEHLGLGLTVARQFAGLHKGRLEYDPVRGFVFHIPRSGVTTGSA
ncbi:MAG: hypothetical protein AMXMBFR84_12700 [Candidatus Hydrogenedentota bacterium]